MWASRTMAPNGVPGHTPGLVAEPLSQALKRTKSTTKTGIIDCPRGKRGQGVWILVGVLSAEPGAGPRPARPSPPPPSSDAVGCILASLGVTFGTLAITCCCPGKINYADLYS
jgi:hypothetical protein